jgi:hypothetical protein
VEVGDAMVRRNVLPQYETLYFKKDNSFVDDDLPTRLKRLRGKEVVISIINNTFKCS